MQTNKTNAVYRAIDEAYHVSHCLQKKCHIAKCHYKIIGRTFLTLGQAEHLSTFDDVTLFAVNSVVWNAFMAKSSVDSCE